MSETTTPRGTEQQPEEAPRPYTAPELVELGQVTATTLGNKGSRSDGYGRRY